MYSAVISGMRRKLEGGDGTLRGQDPKTGRRFRVHSGSNEPRFSSIPALMRRRAAVSSCLGQILDGWASLRIFYISQSGSDAFK